MAKLKVVVNGAPGIGHNSDADTGGVAGKRLRAFVERIERLQEERSGLNGDIKDIMAEAKSTGFDPKIVRKILARRRMDREELQEELELIELYEAAMGIFD